MGNGRKIANASFAQTCTRRGVCWGCYGYKEGEEGEEGENCCGGLMLV